MDHFEYFRNVCANALSGYFRVPLWENAILQVAYTEPAIWQAVVAIGALHRSQMSLMDVRADADDANKRYAAVQYLQAIKTLNQKLDSSTTSLELARLASLLFMIFEALRGNDTAALVHLEGGYSILTNLRNRFQNSASYDPHSIAQFSHLRTSDSVASEPHSSSLDDLEHLMQAFSRVEVSDYQVTYDPKTLVPPTIPENFSSIFEARDAFDTLMGYTNAIVRPYSQEHKTLPHFPLPAEVAIRLEQIQGLLQVWVEVFDSFTKSPSLTTVAAINQAGAINVLSVQYSAALITFSTYFHRDQLSYDTFYSGFLHIIELSEKVVDSTAPTGMPGQTAAPTSFSLFIGILPSLYFTACKCRDTLLRRRAMDLLERAGREGIYNGPALAAIALWAVNKEEEGIGPDGFVVEDKRLHDTQVTVNHATKQAHIVSKTRDKDGVSHPCEGRVAWGVASNVGFIESLEAA